MKAQKCSLHSTFGCAICFYPAKSKGATAMDARGPRTNGAERSIEEIAQLIDRFLDVWDTAEARKAARSKPVAHDAGLSAEDMKLVKAAMNGVKPINRRKVTAQDEDVRYFTTCDPGATLQAPLKHTKYVHKYGE